MSGLLVWNAFINTAKLTTLSSILISLPLTLATLSQPAFLLLSLLLTLYSLIHSTLSLILPSIPLPSGNSLSLPSLLPIFQLPIQPFLLLLVFNLFSTLTQTTQHLITLSQYWGQLLQYASPLLSGLEALASLIVIQSLGIASKELALHSEASQLGLLIASSAAYVGFAGWTFVSFPSAASSPMTAALFGVALSSLFWLTGIGFWLRRTNVVESSGVALFLAWNLWQCTEGGWWPAGEGALEGWKGLGGQYSPLLDNLIPHLETLLKFVTQSLPRPLLAALAFRLVILHLASRIIASMGEDDWDYGDSNGDWESRPSSNITNIILTYRQTILIIVYSHLLLIDHTIDVYWRWANVFFTLFMWSVELLVWGTDDDDQHWKVD